MKKQITLLGLAAIMSLGIASAKAEEINSNGWQIAGIRIANPLDSATWWDGSEQNHGDKITINFASPEFWMNIPNPKMHSNLHGAITNPQTWAQFANVKTYTNMADFNVWEKGLEPKSYQLLTDPQTYAYWAQPGAYMHLANVQHYAQMINPSAYLGLLNQGAATMQLAYEATIGAYIPGMAIEKPAEGETGNTDG